MPRHHARKTCGFQHFSTNPYCNHSRLPSWQTSALSLSRSESVRAGIISAKNACLHIRHMQHYNSRPLDQSMSFLQCDFTHNLALRRRVTAVFARKHDFTLGSRVVESLRSEHVPICSWKNRHQGCRVRCPYLENVCGH